MYAPKIQTRIEIIKSLARTSKALFGRIDGISFGNNTIEVTLNNGQALTYRPTDRKVCRYMDRLSTCSDRVFDRLIEDLISVVEEFRSQNRLGIACIHPRTNLGSLKCPRKPPKPGTGISSPGPRFSNHMASKMPTNPGVGHGHVPSLSKGHTREAQEQDERLRREAEERRKREEEANQQEAKAKETLASTVSLEQLALRRRQERERQRLERQREQAQKPESRAHRMRQSM